jgi:predicted secreted protein
MTDHSAEPDNSQEIVVEGRPSEAVTLPLTSGPATGYGWLLDLPDGVTRIEDTPGRDIPEGRRMGGAAGGHLQVTAPAGEHRITARFARPWEPDRVLQTVTIRLVIS